MTMPANDSSVARNRRANIWKTTKDTRPQASDVSAVATVKARPDTRSIWRRPSRSARRWTGMLARAATRMMATPMPKAATVTPRPSAMAGAARLRSPVS
jgi:hypothetical protein